jgi:hypothetical protein
MTQPASAPARRPPGRRWYFLAILIFIAGWAGMAMFLASRLSGSAERMMRVLVPGQTEIRLNEPGTYTIFHEFQSTFEGRVYNVDNISGLEITVRPSAGGAALPLKGGTTTNYSVGSRSGRSLFQFEVTTPGAYRVVGTYPTGRQQPQTVLAIDRGFVGELLLTIFGGIAIAFGSMAIAITMIMVVFIRRRRARRAGAPA